MDLCGDKLENVKSIDNIPAGTAVKMYGEDSNGDLVADDVPSGGGELPEGTENQILRHNGENWEASDISSLTGIVKSVKRVLTKSEILNLHTTPITLLNVGSNYVIKPICCIIKPLSTCNYNNGYFYLEANDENTLRTQSTAQKRNLNYFNIQETLMTDQTAELNNIQIVYYNEITDNGDSGDVAIILQYILFDLTSIPITQPLYELRYLFYNLTFYWNEIPNAIRYYLERSDDGINDFEVIYDGVANEFQYTPDDGVGFYRVRARDEDDYAEYSDVIEQWYYETLPPPSNLQLDGTTLTWDLVHTATEYSIYRSVVNIGQPAAEYSLQGKTYSEDATTFEVNLESGKRNYFRINTKNQTQYAVPSEAIWIEV